MGRGKRRTEWTRGARIEGDRSGQEEEGKGGALAPNERDAGRVGLAPFRAGLISCNGKQ